MAFKAYLNLTSLLVLAVSQNVATAVMPKSCFKSFENLVLRRFLRNYFGLHLKMLWFCTNLIQYMPRPCGLINIRETLEILASDLHFLESLFFAFKVCGFLPIRSVCSRLVIYTLMPSLCHLYINHFLPQSVSQLCQYYQVPQ